LLDRIKCQDWKLWLYGVGWYTLIAYKKHTNNGEYSWTWKDLNLLWYDSLSYIGPQTLTCKCETSSTAIDDLEKHLINPEARLAYWYFQFSEDTTQVCHVEIKNGGQYRYGAG
jgi:hypothetical protein